MTDNEALEKYRAGELTAREAYDVIHANGAAKRQRMAEEVAWINEKIYSAAEKG